MAQLPLSKEEYQARKRLTKEQRNENKRRLKGFYDQPEDQARLGGTYVERTSIRHMNLRTKGMPYSRCLLADMRPSPMPGTPGVLKLKHPTKGRVHYLKATPELLAVFYPGIQANPMLASVLLGN